MNINVSECPTEILLSGLSENITKHNNGYVTVQVQFRVPVLKVQGHPTRI